MASPVILNALAHGAYNNDPEVFGRAQMRGQQMQANQQQMRQNALTFDQQQQDRQRSMQQQTLSRDVVEAAAPILMSQDENANAAHYQGAVQSLKQKYGDSLGNIPDQYPGAASVFGMVAGYLPDDLRKAIYERRFAPPKQAELTNDQRNAQAYAADPNFKNYMDRQRPADSTKAPAGYRLRPDGSLEPIPGGPADMKAQAEAEKKAAAERDFEAQANYSMDLIDALAKHPGLETSVGAKGLTGGLLAGWVPSGTDAADFKTRLDQLQGRQFLEAYNSLKGGGQITEVEGKKATEAMGRLSTAQSETEFKAALAELKDVLQKGIQRKKAQAAVQGDARIPSVTAQAPGGAGWSIKVKQ